MDQTIGFGAAPADMQITDDEMGRMTSLNGLTVGNSRNGDITVNGLTVANTDTVGTLTLVALRSARKTTFTGTDSAFQGLTVQAAQGINAAASISTAVYEPTLNAGSGTLTLASSVAVTSSNQFVTITANDVVLQGNLITGTGTTLVTAGTFVTVGLGTDSETLNIHTPSDLELQRIQSKGMQVGGLVNQNIKIVGVVPTTITNIITLLAQADDQKLQFLTTSSTFPALAAWADNGINVETSITTLTGDLWMDADLDHDVADDTDNNMAFSTGKTITSRNIMTLEDYSSYILQAGDLTLKARDGIILESDASGGGGIYEFMLIVAHQMEMVL
jgi:hypothetical protein